MKDKLLSKAGWGLAYFLIFFLFVYLFIQTLAFWGFVRSRGLELSFFMRGEKIGVLKIDGTLDRVQPMLDRLNTLEERSDIKALLVDINSPGGNVGPTQELSGAVEQWRETTQKPVVSFVRKLGASGGYHVAVTADTIVANPGSMVGSIGVIMQFIKAEELVDKVGIEYEVVKSGEFKNTGSPFRTMKPEEREVLREIVMDVYDQFIEHVNTNRGELQRPAVERLADGRIFSGRQALNENLIDVTGGRKKAIEILRKAAGIEGEPVLVEPSLEGYSLTEGPRQLFEFFTVMDPAKETGVQLMYMKPEWGI